MKQIVFIRHGKASHEQSFAKDIERPLIEKGIERTKKISKYLSDNNIIPDLIISSNAIRAFETAKFIAHTFNYNEKNIKVFDSLYGCNTEEYLNLIHSISNKINTLFVFGHNPEISECFSLFSGQHQLPLPTSGTAIFSSVSKKWSEIHPKNTKLIKLLIPKEI